MTNNLGMPLTASQIAKLLGGTNATARFFGVQPPSVTYWLERGEIPEGKLIPKAARLESKTEGVFSRATQWPDRWQEIWPELAISAETSPSGEGAHA